MFLSGCQCVLNSIINYRLYRVETNLVLDYKHIERHSSTLQDLQTHKMGKGEFLTMHLSNEVKPLLCVYSS